MSAPARFSRRTPCPICGGGHDDKPKQGIRCAGFLSDDGTYAHCTRAEHAGGLSPNEKCNPPTYAHRLEGSCKCGATHGGARPSNNNLSRSRTPKRLPDSAFDRCVKPYPCDYTDESGTVLYRIARWDKPGGGKICPGYQPAGPGEWLDTLDGIARVAFCLPLVRKAIKERRTIILCEGEKKALMLQALGFAATTNEGGALNFTKAHAEGLRGALRVVVILDSGDDGQKRGVVAPPLLHAVGVSDVRVLTPPGCVGGQGVDDWHDARAAKTDAEKKRELEALMREAPRWNPPPVVSPPPVDAETRADSPVVVTRLSTVTPRKLSWLWRHRIPRDMVTLLTGHGGLGKSTLLLDLAARATTGRPMPDGFELEGGPVSVVIFTAEDAIDSVVVPRLILAGADLSRIITLSAKTKDGEERPLMVTPADIALLEDTARSEGAALVIYDPLVAYVDAEANMHVTQDARRVIGSLHRMAERLHLSVVGIAHWNKSQSPDPSMRVSGSAAIVQAARSALMVGADPDDETGERMVLALHKRNLAPRDTPSLAFRLAVDPGAEHPRVEWLGESSVTSQDMAAMPSSPEERSILDEAVAYLRDTLSGGAEVSYAEIVRGAPCKSRTLTSAKLRAGVVSRRDGGREGRWLWSIPAEPPDADDGRPPKDARHPTVSIPFASLRPLPNEASNLLLGAGEVKGRKDARAPEEVKGRKALPGEEPWGSGWPELPAIHHVPVSMPNGWAMRGGQAVATGVTS